MSSQEIREGTVVENVKAPEWGPGKVVHISGDTMHIIFRDLEEQMARMFKVGTPTIIRAPIQNDPILDNLPPAVEKKGRWLLPARRLTLESLRRRFMHHFHAGFSDPIYLSEERDYKLAAHIRFKKTLQIDKITELLANRSLVELGKCAGRVVGPPLNILSVFENAAFHDAMKDEHAVETFFKALLAALQDGGIRESTIAPYFRAVVSLPAEKSRVGTWPVATSFLYMADPARFMFLKPTVTIKAAESLGFDLKYDSEPNWKTYEALQRMGEVYLDLLAPMGARDFVDVQSFIYVTCHEEAKKSKKAAGASKR